jgi:hypothetical protein
MLPTEQVGSIPRPTALIQGIQDFEARRISQAQLNELYLAAVQETIQRLEATGSPSSPMENRPSTASPRIHLRCTFLLRMACRFRSLTDTFEISPEFIGSGE